MSNQADHTIVRLRVPPELKKQIEDSAEQNNRSQSSEMVARLEQSFVYDSTLPKILDDQLTNSLNAIQNFQGLFEIIKNLQEKIEKQNQLLEKLSEEKE